MQPMFPKSLYTGGDPCESLELPRAVPCHCSHAHKLSKYKLVFTCVSRSSHVNTNLYSDNMGAMTTNSSWKLEGMHSEGTIPSFHDNLAC